MPKRDILYHYRISIKEGLDIQTEKPHLETIIDTTISIKCIHCRGLFLIAKNFKNEERVCNVCFKIVTDIDKFGKMHIIWVNNSKYRAYINLCKSFADEIMRKREPVDKYGYITLKFLLKSKRTFELHCICIARLTIQM